MPEMPYNFDAVLMAVKQRNKAGKRFSILAVAEGAISQEDAQMSKKEYQKKKANSPFPSVSYEIGKKIQDALGQEVRIVVPGHTQRGGSPDAYDRVVASRLVPQQAEWYLKASTAVWQLLEIMRLYRCH